MPEITVLFWVVKAFTTALGEATSDFMVHVMDPVVAVLLGYFVGGEELGSRTILGTLLVLISVVVITTTRAKKPVRGRHHPIAITSVAKNTRLGD